MYESVKAGKIVFEESKDTLSDGTAGGIEENAVHVYNKDYTHISQSDLLQITLQPCVTLVDEWILVHEVDIKRAVKFMLDEHHKVSGSRSYFMNTR